MWDTYFMILKGLTQKGKNRIRELGNEWTLVREKPSVLFDPTPGPWWLVIPLSGDETKSRWIHSSKDKDFEVIE